MIRKRSTLAYAGPSTFDVATPERLQRDLQAMAAELARLYTAVAFGCQPLLPYAATLRAAGALELGKITPIETPTGTHLFALPAWSPENIGRLVGLERRTLVGSVQVYPVGDGITLNGVTTPDATAALWRVNLYIQSPIGWVGLDDA